MRIAAAALMILMSLGLLEGASAASGEPQTDWYSRGIIRQQTINRTTHRQRKRAHKARKVRRARRHSRAGH